MLYVSFVEIFGESAAALTASYGEGSGQWASVASFFGGILLIARIDNLIPAAENPHETPLAAEIPLVDDPLAALPGSSAAPCELRQRPPPGPNERHLNPHSLMRMGLITAVAIGIHNFPEGVATFVAALEDPALGLAIAIAIALHNIPEGISVSVPIFYATGDRKKALVYSGLTGLSEPVGAGVAYLGLRLFVGSGAGAIPSEVMGVLFGGVAGIMVYISLDELLPTSHACGMRHESLLGLIAGMVVMAVSLLLLN
jgi:ZIP family zinc transporter